MPELQASREAYLTDAKRVAHLGSARGGTSHFWHVTISSVALLVLTPLFVFTFGRVLGEPLEVVLLYYSQPFPAIVAALMFAVTGYHFRQGVQVLITDYTRGLTRKLAIVAAICLSYGAAALGVFAVVLLALRGI
jgi:succinate dehydrogenase / fumarate reductase membrane anchor subunit